MTHPDRPTSITGGVAYDRTPMPGRAVTCRYIVEWVCAGQQRHYVSTAAWRGPMPWRQLDLFKRQVAREMRRFPPI